MLVMLMAPCSYSLAGREFQTPLIRSYCETKADGSYDAHARILVTFKNLSSVPQTVTVTYQDLSYNVAAAFSQTSDRNDLLKDWTDPSDSHWRAKHQSLTETQKNFTIQPFSSLMFPTMSLQCFYEDNKPCIFTDAEQPSSNPTKGKVIWVNLAALFSLKVSVTQDRGAVSASLLLQTQCSDGQINGSYSSIYETILLNGGRPF
jgi:hypothetical protein